ncbi:Fur family transcriptional regulator [Kineococcus sp. SYSU DK004]|uniref:Fur family transcriptional regulator n=1 Tax=Kineococcus sp. SYSU DK004 TaxID=3383125 RepID=UPI003D7CC5B0
MDVVGRDGAGGRDELGTALHARGLRVTPQRERVLTAVRALGHATAEEVSAHLGAVPGGAAVDPSTVYRALAVLEDVGLVARTQLDRRSPSFSALEHGGHVHLVCDRCGDVGAAPSSLAGPLARELADRTGFALDTHHLALRGTCRTCRAGERATGPAPAPEPVEVP